MAPRCQSRCQVAGFSVASTTASSGAIPAATASRTIPLMWPFSAMSSGSRSSVQNAIRFVPNSRTSGSSPCRFRAIEASRMSSHMPLRSRSRPSSAVSASWSERIPAAAYAFSALSRTPGAWPSTWTPVARRSFSSSLSSPVMTPGKFIISARPSTRMTPRKSLSSVRSGSTRPDRAPVSASLCLPGSTSTTEASATTTRCCRSSRHCSTPGWSGSSSRSTTSRIDPALRSSKSRSPPGCSIRCVPGEAISA